MSSFSFYFCNFFILDINTQVWFLLANAGVEIPMGNTVNLWNYFLICYFNLNQILTLILQEKVIFLFFSVKQAQQRGVVSARAVSMEMSVEEFGSILFWILAVLP